MQERSENDKLPSPPKLQLSRDLSHRNAKPAVKFTASWLRGLVCYQPGPTKVSPVANYMQQNSIHGKCKDLSHMHISLST